MKKQQLLLDGKLNFWLTTQLAQDTRTRPDRPTKSDLVVNIIKKGLEAYEANPVAFAERMEPQSYVQRRKGIVMKPDNTRQIMVEFSDELCDKLKAIAEFHGLSRIHDVAIILAKSQAKLS